MSESNTNQPGQRNPIASETPRIGNVSRELIDLTAKWYEYVVKNHHKDRDCHWYVTTDYAYGEAPTYKAYHYGYVAGDLDMPERETYAEAEFDLLAVVGSAIAGQREYVEAVLKQPKEYDDWQIEQAKTYQELFADVATLPHTDTPNLAGDTDVK